MEPRGGKPGHGPRPSHRPEKESLCLQAGRVRQHRGENPRSSGQEGRACSRGALRGCRSAVQVWRGRYPCSASPPATGERLGCYGSQRQDAPHGGSRGQVLHEHIVLSLIGPHLLASPSYVGVHRRKSVSCQLPHRPTPLVRNDKQPNLCLLASETLPAWHLVAMPSNSQILATIAELAGNLIRFIHGSVKPRPTHPKPHR